jgi:hypothetical protein
MNEDRRLSWFALVVLLAAIAISLVVTKRLPFLNFFYLPVLLAAYWSGHRAAIGTALVSVAAAAILLEVRPGQFAAFGGPDLARLEWLNLGVWGCVLVLAGYASGTLMDVLRERGGEGARAERPEVRLYNIGTLAIVKGYLRHDQVLKILQIQQKSGKLFGEIAVGLRLLTRDQVDELLRLQREKRSITSSEIAIAKLEISKARKPR